MFCRIWMQGLHYSICQQSSNIWFSYNFYLVDASIFIGFSRWKFSLKEWLLLFLLLSYSLFFPRMIQSLRSEALKSEDMFMYLQEIQESIRLAFLNCFLHFSGIMMSHYISFMSGWLVKIFLATLNYVVILCALIRSPGEYWRWAFSN